MTWNYRVIHSSGKSPEPWEEYAVHEVYYENEKPHFVTMNAIAASGKTREELIWTWEKYQHAFREPILVYDFDLSQFAGEEPPMICSTASLNF